MHVEQSAVRWASSTADHYVELTKVVIDQTVRRVLRGESVPSAEKLVSIFEPHTDTIVKDRRETLYGHKVCRPRARRE